MNDGLPAQETRRAFYVWKQRDPLTGITVRGPDVVVRALADSVASVALLDVGITRVLMDEPVMPTDWEVYRTDELDAKAARQAAERVFAKLIQYQKKFPGLHAEIALRVSP